MADFFIRRPIVAMVIAILTVIVGLVSLKRLPIAEYPDIAPPTVQVTASYPGASAETITYDGDERAFIEMHDRRMEFYLLGSIANCIRHTHPGLAPLEQPQFPDYGRAQGDKVREVAAWLDGELQRQPFVAGTRFTIADITAFVAVEFGKLMKFRPGDEGFAALQAWRDRIAERPSAKAGA